MDKVFERILIHRKAVLVTFAAALFLCVFLARTVTVNFNLLDYLPAETPSTVALRVMGEEYSGGFPNVRIMVPNVTVPEAAALKKQIEAVDGVANVMWLDDVASLEVPLETLDPELVETYYKDGHALFSATVEQGKEISALNEIRRLIGEDGAMAGVAVDAAVVEESTGPEVQRMMLLVVPLCFLILLLTTSSWFEAVLFMLTIGAAIILNRGTNALLGEISFVSNAAGSILQLAVSMDYAIFLLHRFAECRQDGMDIQAAMLKAMKKSAMPVLASALTTVIGFAALMPMRFRIGSDMGVVMAKAIALSLVTVFTLLPAMTLYTYKLIDRTQHRPLVPDFHRFARLVFRLRIPALVLFLLILVPAYLAQGSNSFYYGASRIFTDESTRVVQDRQAIEKVFGKANILALMVPKGDLAKEAPLSRDLHQIPQVTSVISYVDNVGAEVPMEFLDPGTVSQLLSDHYSRMLITVNTDFEGDEVFDLVERIRALAHQYYGEDYHLAGTSVSTYDLKQVITADMLTVNLIAIGSIFLTLLLSLRSVSLPAVLVLVIETAIWINLSVPYFADQPLYYISYIIISSVQLGATVDYAILLTSRYLEERERLGKLDAVQKAVQSTTLPILTSASILTLGGTVLGVFSSHGVVSQLGYLVGRGAVLSALLVLLVLPALLYLLDSLILRTTRGLQAAFPGKEAAQHA
ncbi:MAG TPA: MMPL family transporter [Symbiobacteriaceae bacterium]